MRRTIPALVTVATLAVVLEGTVAAQGGTRDCAVFGSQAEAQAAFRESPSDAAGNDADNDGLACELFPYDDNATDLAPVGASDVVVRTPAAAGLGGGRVASALPRIGAGRGVARSPTGAATALLGLAALCAAAAVAAASVDAPRRVAAGAAGPGGRDAG